MFERGRIYMTTDWFTGGTIKFHYVGRKSENIGLFRVENFELDGEHNRDEEFEISKDENGEYIYLGSYNNHEHRLYAKGDE